MKRGYAGWACVGILSAAPVTDAAEGGQRVLRSQVRDPRSRAVLEKAFSGASRKLSEPECARVFSDFHDDSGRPLQNKVDALNVSASGYLALVVFADAHGGACADRDVLAITSPGSRVVVLCPGFARIKSDGYRESILIHETLHTLGLGENPPHQREHHRASGSALRPLTHVAAIVA